MNYTVQALAQLSGISVRTLHYYDDIGLLKPAYVTENGYRYYQKDQLLQLQQILFLKELGFELKQIHAIITNKELDQIAVLQKHKKALQEKVIHLNKLMQTIDKTIDHYERKQIMQDHELFVGFSTEKQQAYEEYLVERHGKEVESRITESYKNIKQWTKKDWDYIKTECDSIYKALIKALSNNVPVDDQQVQITIKRYFDVMNKFYTQTQESFNGLATLYIEHPDFRAFYDQYHPALAEYLAKAMRVFSQTIY